MLPTSCITQELSGDEVQLYVKYHTLLYFVPIICIGKTLVQICTGKQPTNRVAFAQTIENAYKLIYYWEKE